MLEEHVAKQVLSVFNPYTKYMLRKFANHIDVFFGSLYGYFVC